MQLPWHLYVMAAIYFFAGVNHFRVPRLYLRIIPPSLPNPKLLNYISGAAEVLLGIALCIPVVSHIAAWGIIALLVAVFPANIYMVTNPKAAMKMPKWLLLLRLPMQILLIYWAWLYT
ncbi:DoxX family protein [Flavobacterium psychrotrophum]|uniref:DoxX family protein n=1 Tax=Flavobacterium psychrotrophum TaxID=2294119 RepID=UPI000E31FFD8|nr:DoxX family protein [Flavobacterium psychrotrophum]